MGKIVLCVHEWSDLLYFLGRHVWACLALIVLVSCAGGPPSQFQELLPEETGVNFRNDIVETQHNNILTYEYTYNGGGVAAGDLNNDGLPDLYFVGNSVPNKLFVNRGDWKFEDVTATAGVAGRDDWCTGVSFADVNGDGWLDIYVCYSGNAPGEGYNLPVVRDYPRRANELFINNGGEPGSIPTFTESAVEYGLDAIGTFSTQGYFFDYDRDGDLDMFLLNHANMFYAAFFNTSRLRTLRHPYFGNKLYRNDNGKFVEVSEEAGIHGSGLNFGLSAAISDLNHDNWPDIYVTNDYEEQDFCYINNGDGTFTEVSHTLFGHLSKFGMGSDIADLNNDGLQDIVVLDMLPEDNYRQKLLKGPDEYDKYMLAVDSGYHHQYMRNTLQLNRGFAPDGLPRFSEIGQLAGISNTDWSWAPLVADFDNDGLRDIFAGNGYLRDFNNMDFMKYTSTVYEAARNARAEVDYVKLIQDLPSTELANYVFKNEDGIKFTNVTEAWGFRSKAVTNGAAYADFDNDGDLDLVMNNLNGQAGLFRNNQEKLEKRHYIRLRLVGKAQNPFGVGARVWVRAGERTFFYEAYPQRGYLSSVDPVLTIGLGEVSHIDELRVVWPDGNESVESNLKADEEITVDAAKSKPASDRRTIPNPTLLNDVTRESGIDFAHKENAFVDYKTQRLLFSQLSRLGGMLSVGDVNRDGNDDVFFGGAAGQPGALYLGTSDGGFRKAASIGQAEASSEDMGSVFFDADGDGDLDLYIVSGGSEHEAGSVLYQDRLYLNRGDGTFELAVGALPREVSAGSCVVAADFDQDGDEDLFVGGRHVPFSYGLFPRSYLLRNDSDQNGVRFTDVSGAMDANLANPGMVTAALWTDVNGDSWPDLVIAGEWMPVMVFENQKGKLVERDFPGLRNINGWWTTIFAADVDGDGDEDYLVGNAGTNLQFKASADEPVQLFAGDFNDDGTIDPILCYYIQGRSYPLASRDELLDQMTSLRKKFITYADYANATMQDIAPAAALEKAYRLNAYRLESVWIENKGSDFEMHVLPDIAQFSTINGFLFEDFDGDGTREVLAAGNFFPYKPQLGRCDASTGVVLRFDGNGGFIADGVQSNVWLTGDIRAMSIVRSSNGARRVVVSRNNDKAAVFEVAVGVGKATAKN